MVIALKTDSSIHKQGGEGNGTSDCVHGMTLAKRTRVKLTKIGFVVKTILTTSGYHSLIVC